METITTPEVTNVHPLKRQRTLISTKLVDFENLTAFEAVTMSLALYLAVFIGVLQAGSLS